MKGYFEEKGKIAEMTVAVALSVLGVVFVSLSLPLFEGGFLLKYRFLIAFLLFFCVSFCLIAYMILFFFRKEALSRSVVSLLVLLDLFLLVFYLLLLTGFWKIVHDVESFREYLEKSGGWMDILFIVLQFLQVVILPIPSFVTLVAGTTLFGAVCCFLYSYFAIVLGSLTAFFIGRFLGSKAVVWMVGEETLDKWLKKVKGKDNLILTAMFLLPLFPDDVLCFVAGLSSMTARYFTVMIMIARAISVSTTCFSIDLIPFNTWWGLLCWGLIAVVVVVAFVLLYKYQDKIQSYFKNRRKRKTHKGGGK